MEMRSAEFVFIPFNNVEHAKEHDNFEAQKDAEDPNENKGLTGWSSNSQGRTRGV